MTEIQNLAEEPIFQPSTRILLPAQRVFPCRVQRALGGSNSCKFARTPSRNHVLLTTTRRPISRTMTIGQSCFLENHAFHESCLV